MNAKNELRSCIGCGRDTKNKDQLCYVCRPGAGRRIQPGSQRGEGGRTLSPEQVRNLGDWEDYSNPEKDEV